MFNPSAQASRLADDRAAIPAAARRAAAIVSATVLVALAAHVSFPLPFTPIPFTMQPLAVLGIGLWLGPLDGALALVAYLLEGVMYLPVFTPGGPGGLAQLLGLTGGYLLAYPAVAGVAGGLTRRAARSFSSFPAALLGCSCAVLLLFSAGGSWFRFETHWSWSRVWMATILPFLPGEAVKIFTAAGAYRALTFRRLPN